MALTVAGGSASRAAAEDTRAALLARGAIEELRRARLGSSELIKGWLPWPEFPEGGGRLLLAADRDGRLVSVLEESQYELGVADRELGYLVSLRGTAHSPGRIPADERLAQVEVRVETPPRAGREHRRAQVFVRLMHPDD
jgi:hypothetical protein